MTHTPTPWKAKLAKVSQRLNQVIGPDGSQIALCQNGHPVMGVKSVEEHEANAAFIVQAVNAHDALVERLIECQEFIIGYHAAEENDMRRRILGEIIVKNNAALKRARGE